MFKKILLATVITTVVFSCKKKKDSNNYFIPTSYEFKNTEGESTVSFSGPEDRRAQLGELVTYMLQKHANVSANVTASDLDKMYNNNGAESGNAQNAGGLFSFSSEKQLEDKTANSLAVTKIKSWFVDFQASDSLTQNTDGSSILINKKGQEYVHLVEKGLMGAIFFNQAVENYLNIDELLASDNTTAVVGQNYTEREHAFDEAFGYFGAGIDFPAEGSIAEYYAEYAKSTGLETTIMGAFLHGRSAIINKDNQGLRDQVVIIRKNWEAIIGQQAAKDLKEAIANYSYGDNAGDFCQPLSEAYAFIWSLRFKSDARLSDTEIDSYLTILSDFSTVKKIDLATIKAKLEVTYGSK